MTENIRVAIVGVGNCASSLVQGLAYYHNGYDRGLITPSIGGYEMRDIEIVAAFDVDARKVGLDVADAIFTAPNCTLKFCGVPRTGVTVQRGSTRDGLGSRYLRELVEESEEPEVNVAEALRAAGAQVVVNYLPVGSEAAARFYAREAILAGCAFVNCMPTFIASDDDWRQRFYAAGLPIVGDDIKSQVGATIVHRELATLMKRRGVRLLRTSQLNVGGNTDFRNMLERDRLQSKKISKTRAVTSVAGHELPARDVHIGPSDYVEWLDDRKWAYIRLEGVGFGGAPLSMEVKLEVHDSPNSAGVVADAIRCARVALDRKQAGAISPACAWYMKSPPVQREDEDAMRDLEAWLAGGSL